nr:immunoglobulin light chain junction region [Macaca mulatta]
CLQGYSTPYIF